MGHKVGTMACKSSVYIDIDQPESTPLLLKKNYQAISTPKKTCDSSIILLSCFLIVGSLIGLYLLLEQDQTLKFNVPFFMVERSVLNFAGPKMLLLGGPPTNPSPNSNGIVFLNTRFPQCFTKEMCTEIIKSLIGLGVKVQQNFLIGGDGHVYEILGWDHSSKDMMTVGFMGDFTNKMPPKLMFDVAKALISESIRRKHLNSNYNVFGMRNNSLTDDGDALYEHLAAEWPQWKTVIEGN